MYIAHIGTRKSNNIFYNFLFDRKKNININFNIFTLSIVISSIWRFCNHSIRAWSAHEVLEGVSLTVKESSCCDVFPDNDEL